MKHTTIAVDVAKSVFEIGISHRPGHVDKHHRLSRNQLSIFFAGQPPATVVMEACSSSQSLGAAVHSFWTRCEATSALLCPALCSALEDRSHGRERHARSLAE